jgi:hypothetical protein
MAQTRMFRDRVVSMEQTLEGGEKHLPLLKEICREALPDLEYREHTLDHERDLFVMEMERPGGARQRVCWTRMMLFDAERIPTMSVDPAGALRARIIEFLRARAAKPEIVVTFRHLEDGWVDTPEPKREGRRRRRGGRGGRGGERGAGGPDRRPQAAGPGGKREGGGHPPARGGAAAPTAAAGPRGGGAARPQPAAAPAQAGAASGPADGAGGGGKRRRRFRRRRRGGGGGGSGRPPASGGAPPAGGSGSGSGGAPGA